MEWIQLLLYAGVLIAFLFWIYNARPKRFPPGPYGLPIVGYQPFLGKRPYKTFMELGKKYGSPFSLPLGNKFVVVLNDWKSVKEAFINQAEVFNGRPKNIINEEFFRYKDIIISDGPSWKERRRFTMQHLRDFGFGKATMENIVMDEVHKEIAELQAHQNETLNFNYHFFFSFLNIVWTIVGGRHFEQDDQLKKELVHYLEVLASQITATNPLNFMPQLIHLHKKSYNTIISVSKNVDRLFHLEIDQHVSTYQEGNPRDFIDVFIGRIFKAEESQEKTESFHKSNLVEIMKNLFSAGVETSNTLLTWDLLYMASFPEIQKKVQQEVDKVVGRERLPCYQDRLSLPYVEAVQLEIYRICTVVPFAVLHRTTARTQLFDYDLPKDTVILPNIWGVHHDPNYWKDPHVFRPERFLNENGKIQRPEYLIPFSAGSRICLGESLAKVVNFLFLTCLLHQFSFSLIPGEKPPSLEPVYAATLRAQPFLLTVKQRY